MNFLHKSDQWRVFLKNEGFIFINGGEKFAKQRVIKLFVIVKVPDWKVDPTNAFAKIASVVLIQ
jgi:hypothetical protein